VVIGSQRSEQLQWEGRRDGKEKGQVIEQDDDGIGKNAKNVEEESQR